MKHSSFVFIVAAATAHLSGLRALTSASLNTEAEANDDYTLVWADEFDNDGAPDPARWSFEHGFVRNHELQWYQEENARC